MKLFISGALPKTLNLIFYLLGLSFCPQMGRKSISIGCVNRPQDDETSTQSLWHCNMPQVYVYHNKPPPNPHSLVDVSDSP